MKMHGLTNPKKSLSLVYSSRFYSLLKIKCMLIRRLIAPMINWSTYQHLINFYISQENVLEVTYMNRFRDRIWKVFSFSFLFCSVLPHRPPPAPSQDPFHIPPVSLNVYPLWPTIPPANRWEDLKFRFYCIRDYFRFWDGNTIFHTGRVSLTYLGRCGNLLVENTSLIIKR